MSFSLTLNPTPFGIYDSDTTFQTEADSIVTFVKRRMGDDILSVELTKKQIWANLEEATLEYSTIINNHQAKSQIISLLGMPTGSLQGQEQKYIRENLEFMVRSAEAYSMESGVGGSYDSVSGSLQMEDGRQDYNLYTELKDLDGNVLFNDSLGKMKIMEVFHYNPQAAYRFFDTTSAVNYLNNEFSFESFTPETIFYVLPVFEDILRAGQMDLSNRVRRSNYSYEIFGRMIRIYPAPRSDTKKLWIRFRQFADPTNPAYKDESIYGVSNLSNVPFGNIMYSRINSPGRQWIRQYCLALSREQLGLIRSKFSSVPIPGAEVTLNGASLISEGREDQVKLKEQLIAMLDTLTYDKLAETQALRAENLNKQLKYVPIPAGKSIFMG